jgi:hypothetical protein
VLQLGLGLAELCDRGAKRLGYVRAPFRLEVLEALLHDLLRRELLQWEDPLGFGVERKHAHDVLSRERAYGAGGSGARDIGLVDAALLCAALHRAAATVAPGHASGSVDHQRLCHRRLALGVFDIGVDRKDLLEFGPTVAAESVGVLAADRDQPSAGLAYRRPDGGDLIGG